MRPGRKEGGCKDGLGGQDEGKEAGEDQEAGARYSTLCVYWQDLKILLEVSWTREQAWELPKPNSGCGCAVNAKCAGGPGVFPSKAASCRGCTQPRDGSNNSSRPLQLSQLSTSTFPGFLRMASEEPRAAACHRHRARELGGLGVPTTACAKPSCLPRARKSCTGRPNLPCKVPNPSHANSSLPPSTDTNTGPLTSSNG